MTDMAPNSISHDRADDTAEAKARWFQSLPLATRMETLCSFTELILAVNPKIVEQRALESIRHGIPAWDIVDSAIGLPHSLGPSF